MSQSKTAQGSQNPIQETAIVPQYAASQYQNSPQQQTVQSALVNNSRYSPSHISATDYSQNAIMAQLPSSNLGYYENQQQLMKKTAIDYDKPTQVRNADLISEPNNPINLFYIQQDIHEQNQKQSGLQNQLISLQRHSQENVNQIEELASIIKAQELYIQQLQLINDQNQTKNQILLSQNQQMYYKIKGEIDHQYEIVTQPLIAGNISPSLQHLNRSIRDTLPPNNDSPTRNNNPQFKQQQQQQQQGYPQQGYPQQGQQQQGPPQQGYPQQGAPQQGSPSQGVPPQNALPHALVAQGPALVDPNSLNISNSNKTKLQRLQARYLEQIKKMEVQKKTADSKFVASQTKIINSK